MLVQANQCQMKVFFVDSINMQINCQQIEVFILSKYNLSDIFHFDVNLVDTYKLNYFIIYRK